MKPAPAEQAERDRRLLGLAREGKTLAQIGAALGVSRQAAQQRLAHLGHRIHDFPAARQRGRCSFCGAPLHYTKATAAHGLHVCAARRCLSDYRRELLRRQRALALAWRDSREPEGGG